MDGNYIVMVVTLVVWIGLFSFVFRLDRKVAKLEENQQ